MSTPPCPLRTLLTWTCEYLPRPCARTRAFSVCVRVRARTEPQHWAVGVQRSGASCLTLTGASAFRGAAALSSGGARPCAHVPPHPRRRTATPHTPRRSTRARAHQITRGLVRTHQERATYHPPSHPRVRRTNAVIAHRIALRPTTHNRLTHAHTTLPHPTAAQPKPARIRSRLTTRGGLTRARAHTRCRRRAPW
eukprot:3437166-Prymnesium_polylepis.1